MCAAPRLIWMALLWYGRFMAKKSAPKQDDPKQAKRFIEAAKEIGVDEDPKAFDKAFKKVTAQAPKK